MPQIYDGVSSFIMLILLTAPKFILFALFIKLYLFVFKNFTNILSDFFLINAIFSLFLVLLELYGKLKLNVFLLIVL